MNVVKLLCFASSLSLVVSSAAAQTPDLDKSVSNWVRRQ